MARGARGVWAGLLAAILALAGCRSDPGLTVQHRIDAPAPAATLHVDAAGVAWVGRPGALQRLGSAAVELGVDSAPSVVGRAPGVLLVRAGDEVLALDSAGTQVVGRRNGVGSAALHMDPRGRWLLQGAASGAVLAQRPADSLQVLWSWPSLGAPTTALAASPQGDRLYQALAVGDGEGGNLLTRDLQTGRLLQQQRFTAPLAALAADPSGDLYLLLSEPEGGGAALRLRPRGGAFQVVWRRTLEQLGIPEAVHLRAAGGGGRLVVWTPPTGTGLRVLDAETGAVVGSEDVPPLDAAFAPDGRLYLLYPGEVRVVR